VTEPALGDLEEAFVAFVPVLRACGR